MRARSGPVSVALLTLALLHAWWGVRMLLASNTFMAGSQIVSAGALLLACVAVRDRSTFAVALGIAALATTVRALGMLPPGPYFAATMMLAAGLGAAAWATRRLDARRPAGWEAIPLRGGFALVAASSLTFLGLGIAAGDAAAPATWDLAIRALAAIVAALFVDAPPLQIGRRKPFAADAASAAR